MRALFGFIQVGLGIGGIIALFSGQWLVLVGCIIGGFVVGVVGNRAVRSVYGISQSGQDALASVPAALRCIERREFVSALGHSRNAVTSFQLGGDKNLLGVAYVVHAAALALNGKIEEARSAARDARASLAQLPPQTRADRDGMLEVLGVVERELSLGVPDKSRLARDFLATNSG